MKSKGCIDGHMWVEVEEENGTKIYDYSENKFEGMSAYGFKQLSWSGKVVYKPFPEEIEDLIVNKMIEYAKKKVKKIKKMPIKKKLANIKAINDRPGRCTLRACLVSQNLKNKKHKIRCGSLGYVQKNGDVWYEWGQKINFTEIGGGWGGGGTFFVGHFFEKSPFS